MFYPDPARPLHHRLLTVLCVAAVAASTPLYSDQDQPQQQQTPASQQQPAQPPSQQQPPDQSAPAAGGPSGDNGSIAIPKKKENPDNTPPPAPAEPKFKNPAGAPNYSIQVNVPEVVVDVGVLLEKTGQFVPGLKPENFRVFENGVEQKVIGFKRVEAPITALMVCEFASTNYNFVYDMQNAAWTFAQQLRPQDYVALMTFDMRTTVDLDFTQDKRELLNAIRTLIIPGFSERNLFDALYEAEDRLSRIEGHKYIILIASGRDTMSRITLDKIMQKVKSTPDVTIFAISTGGWVRAMTEGGGGFNQQLRDLDYLQADNQMKTFAKMTGGMWFNPRFIGELPDDFTAINQAIRSKYELVYHPSDSKQDGTYRKLRVELVDDEGHPLRMQDEKHKQLKYDVIARDGYRAREEVE
ncbi:MAG TPA: VWA domain-containing protein [Terracidiphilus sp.]|nr:VWA domain-containing protein [Terracidiphilus sp.]